MKYDWLGSTIGEICTVVTDGSHYSPKSVPNGEYMVSVKDFTTFGFDFLNCRQISKSDYDDLTKAGCVPEIDDILIGKDGARFFEDIVIYRQPQKPAILSSIAILRANRSVIDPEYLYYLLKSPLFKKNVRDNYGSGSAIPRIILKDFKRMAVKIPPLSVQKNIARILNAFDSRIANNIKINHHLEQMAQAFFADFQSRGTGKIKLIRDIVEINIDTYSEKENWPYVNYLDTSNITDGRIESIQYFSLPDEKLPSRSRRKVFSNDIVYSTVRPNQRHFGIIASPVEHMLVSTGFAVIRSTDEAVCNEFIYLFLTSAAVIELLQQLAEHSVSTFPSIKPSDIGALEIMIPSTDECAEIESLLKPIFRCIAVNQAESTRLVELRDTLLPRLMSGELSIADLGDVK